MLGNRLFAGLPGYNINRIRTAPVWILRTPEIELCLSDKAFVRECVGRITLTSIVVPSMLSGKYELKVHLELQCQLETGKCGISAHVTSGMKVRLLPQHVSVDHSGHVHSSRLPMIYVSVFHGIFLAGPNQSLTTISNFWAVSNLTVFAHLEFVATDQHLSRGIGGF